MKSGSAISFFLSICFSTVLSAQTPEFQWVKKGGGKLSDNGRAAAVDGKGHVYYCGGFSDTATFGSTVLITPVSEGFLARYDLNGQQSWAIATGAFIDELATDTVGNLYIACNFTDSVRIMDSTLYAGANDGLIAKLDTNGHLLWAHTIGGPDYDYIYGLCSDANGDLYVTGIFKTSIQIGDTTLLSPSSNYSIFVAHFNPDGLLIWVAQAGGPGSASVSSAGIAADSAGNVYVCGGFTGSSGFGLPSWGSTTLTGSYNDYIAKLNTSGNWEWAADVAYNPSSGLSDIAADKWGNVYALGTFGYASNPITVAGQQLITPWGNNSDLYLGKWNTNGVFQWVRTAGSYNAFDEAKAVAVDDSGRVYITCSVYDSSRFGAFVFAGYGDYDIGMARYDSLGNEQLAVVAGSEDPDGAADIAVDSSGNAYMTGFYSKVADFGAMSLAGGGTYGNAFLVKYGFPVDEVPTTSIEAVSAFSNIECSPNPASGRLTIDTKDAAGYELTVMNAHGVAIPAVVICRSVRSLELDISTYAPGMYIIILASKDQMKRVKFVKL